MAQAAHRLELAEIEQHRTMPHNIEAEQALLGAILINNAAFYHVSDFLRPDHFFEPLHGTIYEIASGLISANKTVTPITIKTFLPTDLDIAGLSPSQYLARLAAEATTIINAADYGRTIYDLALRRELINIADDIRNAAFEATIDSAPAEQIERAEQRLYEVAETGRFGGGFETFDSALSHAIDRAAQAYQSDSKLSGLPTGLNDLDAKMGGLQPSDLIIIAGRPGMGKTALATNVAYNVARSYRPAAADDSSRKAAAGGIVAFFSLEMSSEQLATRVISEQAEVSSSSIRRGAIDEREFERLVDRRNAMRRIPLYVDQTGGLTVGQLAARARRLKRPRGLDLIVIDYIQLMQGRTQRVAQNRVQELTEITTGLKALAKELNVPIIALSQLSRLVENREEKRPQLSDLRESGSIEQDADVVLFVFREEYYLKNKEPRPGTEEHLKWEADLATACGKAEIIVGKQRHGPTGTVMLSFQGEFTRFADLADDRV
ncbi:replicative DNA helicase (plasmid) [Bradyrhizobium sp. ISRA443]|uniref:replicative DNA helicase n=1 Tax=unclassified Bradyrhizobium TaxID=2631580 RepID=UPI00247847FA|nr:MULTISPECIES: replicative DNA helicase [unclassified Bradyrhizobium]WGS03157.1 replicative DNA helicase [Bradyrhizobium sp. ISRA436]WGS10049.1 replicative DNA helicase [Bradyrhizobium sp. ISRA437]WGS16934.1 replicative DNA helicase [Bradyrhizobium sp. ISRA443]